MTEDPQDSEQSTLVVGTPSSGKSRRTGRSAVVDSYVRLARELSLTPIRINPFADPEVSGSGL